MNHPIDDGAGLKAFSHPRYFYGQLLDVRHFEAEQSYFKRKIWMLNRMVSGFGVVCGLDVGVGQDQLSVVVAPGLALDKRGREIVVPRRSKPIPIEPLLPAEGQASQEKRAAAHDDRCSDDWVHLVICFDEQNADPEPVLAGGCDPVERCAAGSTRETYRIEVRPGRVPEMSLESQIPNLIKGNCINYRALVDWVSAPCDEPVDCCITLANVRRPPSGGKLERRDIEIAVRPIVFGLDLLWEVLLALTTEGQNRRGGKN